MRLSPVSGWRRLKGTYWFLPTVVTLASVALAMVLVMIDRRYPEAWVTTTLAYGGGADGARALLGAVAGSMITVVSVTFSVTVVALSVASQHFGPRLLNNFMRDKAAQLVLGTFIGTFAYCLAVLRTVIGEGDNLTVFVPHLAITGAVVLTLTSVGMLIYYVHHVSASIQIAEITRSVTHDLERAIERLYPEPLGEHPPAPDGAEVPPPDAMAVRATGNGYVQSVDPEELMSLAEEADVRLWLTKAPGDFVTRHTTLARVHPRPADPEAFRDDLNDVFTLGSDRTPEQDAGFPVQQLVEVALHALSPGINEPYTALTCLHRIGQGLANLAGREMPPTGRADRNGRLRVFAAPRTFPELLGEAFDPIRRHAASDLFVAVHMMGVLEMLARQAHRDEDQAAIRWQADCLRDTVEHALHFEAERARIREAARRVHDAVAAPPPG